MNEILHKIVSPPFEGGVALTFTVRAGVVDSLISSYLSKYEKPKPL